MRWISEIVPANNRIPQAVRQGIPDERASHTESPSAIQARWRGTTYTRYNDVVIKMCDFANPNLVWRTPVSFVPWVLGKKFGVKNRVPVLPVVKNGNTSMWQTDKRTDRQTERHAAYT